MGQVYLLLLCVAAVLGVTPTIQIDAESSRIINGTFADEGEFPYIAALTYDAGDLKCGASILTPSWILTAAHCCTVSQTNDTFIYVYTSSIYLSKGGKSFDIAKIIPHPDFIGGANHVHDDICLIQIKGEIPLDSNTQQVKVAPGSSIVPDLSDAVIIGWGITNLSDPQPQSSDRLQKVTQYKARSPAQCQSLSGIPDFPGQICAVGSGGQGVCMGDSGSPLTYKGVQVGLSSIVFMPCGNSGKPDYFTRVSYYIPWIEDNLGPEDFQLIQFGDI